MGSVTDLLQQGYSWISSFLPAQESSIEEETPTEKKEIKKIYKENLPPSNDQRNAKSIKGKQISQAAALKKRSTQTPQHQPDKKVNPNIQNKDIQNKEKVIPDIQDEEMAEFFVKCIAAQGYANPTGSLKKSSYPAPSDHVSDTTKSSSHPTSSSRLVKTGSKSDLCRVKAMDKMPEVEKIPNQEVYNSLIQCNIKRSQLEHAYELLSEMQAHRLPIDRLVCHALLDAFGKEQKIQKMEALFEKMKKEKIKINEATYGILIHGYCKGQQLQRALDYIEEMEAIGLKPNAITYNPLLNAYSELGMIKQISDLLDEMKQKKIEHNGATYNIAIDAYMRVKNLEVSGQLFKQSNLSLMITHEKKLVVLDCHTLSHGSACIGLRHYLEDHKTIRRFCVITGIGKHSKSAKIYEMRDCVQTFLSQLYPCFLSNIEPRNPGRLYYAKVSHL